MLAVCLVRSDGRKFFTKLLNLPRSQPILASALVPLVIWQLAMSGARDFSRGFWNRRLAEEGIEDITQSLLVYPWPAITLLVIALIVGLLAKHRRQVTLATLAVAACLVAVPALASLTLPEGQNYFVPRYFLPLCCVMALWLASLAHRIPAVVVRLLVTLLVVFATWNSSDWYDQAAPTGPYPRNAVQDLAQRWQEGDRVFLCPGHEMPTLRYYGFPGKLDLILHPNDWSKLKPALEEVHRGTVWLVTFNARSGTLLDALTPRKAPRVFGKILVVGL